MKQTLTPFTSIVGLAASMAIPGAQALANDKAESSLILEEIVVTAQKRTQSLQDVPIAVTALNSDFLTQTGAVSLSDIAKTTPGLNINNTQSEDTSISLRGIGSNDFGYSSDKSIPVYLDGVYMGNGTAMIGDLVDIDQIEILKGPQGTLFGRNAVGGAVSVTTAQPGDDIEATLNLGLGNYNLRTFKGMLNLPLIEDQLAMRLNGSLRKRGGWQENVVTGSDDGYEQDRWNGRMKLLWTPVDNLELEFTSDWQDEQDHSGYHNLAFSAFPNALFAPETFDLDNRKAANGNAFLDDIGDTAGPEGRPIDNRLKRKIRGNALKVSWNIDDNLTLTSITSYREIKSAISEDNDGSEYLVLNVRSFLENEEYSQEFRLNGITSTIDWFVGLSAYRSDVDGRVEDSFGGILAGPFSEINRATAKTESYALFGDAIWSINEKTNITLGARYSYDAKSQNLKNTEIGFVFPGNIQLLNANGVPDPSLANAHDNWKDLSLRLVLDYRPNDAVMLFAGISQGYKSGGFNSFPVVDLSGATLIPGTMIPAVPFGSTDPFDEEKITNYEAGFKSTLLEGRFRLNGSIFHYDFEDLQFLVTNGVSVNARNAGEARGQGIDLEAAILLTENLNIHTTLSWLDAEYRQDVINSDGSLVVMRGQDLAYSPHFSANVGVDYIVPLGSLGELRTNLNYSYVGDRMHNSESTDPIYKEDAFGLLNARISFTANSERWELAAWGKNLTDKTFIESYGGVTDDFGFVSVRRGEPRMYGLEFTYLY